jgi:hypothetical protein
MDERLIYVYCTSCFPPESNPVFSDENLEIFTFGNLHAVARYVSPDDFSEENLKKNFGDLGWIEEQTREHIRIINLSMQWGTVVPFKFGTVFKTEDSLEKFFDDYRQALSENLETLKGKEEWALKIYCNNSLLQAHINQNCEAVKALQHDIAESKPGRAFILKRKLAELIEDETHKQLSNYGQLYFEQVEKLSSQTRTNPLLPKEVTERTEDMILNIACLVEKSQVDVLLRKTEVLQEEFRNAGLMPEVTGPWPPFSFITLK